jgi:hypothetical protein
MSKEWWRSSRSGRRAGASNSGLCLELQEFKFPALSLQDAQRQGRGSPTVELFLKGWASPQPPPRP